ncbi:apolipoprotein N-acyltransferase [Allosphingosinicella flava]|uniref:Apolipoprotein N-acyltransferase n=1 Tax=Allosphingosinicella flava TaxID=2771430 RepID=A0A7T2GIZ9_9SPHN|nr:apolipoprotein N-acyltransferase [Sphingosinicella flava]QPQ54764.1 apolipoprotein N-acyltransferase [Sphingosinicella flava]
MLKSSAPAQAGAQKEGEAGFRPAPGCKIAWGYAFVAGLVGASGFEPLGLAPLMLIALAILMWLVRTAPTLRSALARGWWFGAGNFVLGLNWIATAFTFQAAMPVWLGWVAVILLSLYLAIYPAAAAGLAWRWGRSDPLRLVLVFAAAWIVTEWLRATLFTGFAWNPIGIVLLETPVAALATLIGTYGLSGMAVLLSGALFLLAERHLKSVLAVVAPIALLAAILALQPRATIAADAMAIRIVQPNISQADKWKEDVSDRNLALIQSLSGRPSDKPRLLLWPEAAVTEQLQDGRAYPFLQRYILRLRQRVARSIGPNDVLLTGGVTFQAPDGKKVTSATNSIFALNSDGDILARYDKAHLVPYGEYLPMRPILSAIGLSRLAPGDVDFQPGPGAQTIAIPGVGPAGFQLCYEIIFSGQVVDRAHRPAFLFNPSNDAWFGAWGPPQHLAQARLRALEEGLPVLRATPTGISAVIDASGRILSSLPVGTAGAIDARLPMARAPTLFARLGNILPLLVALFLAAIAIAVARKAR